jgi:probable rRNA maturation factor
VTYRVRFQVAPRFLREVRTRALAAFVRKALAQEDAKGAVAVEIVVTDDRTVRDLNRRFLGHDQPTDVLAFPSEVPGFVVAGGLPNELGQIVVSLPTARRQARLAGHMLEDELRHLILHGLLHLIGYDHERRKDAVRMRAREEQLLGRAVH